MPTSYIWWAQNRVKNSRSWNQGNTNRWKYHMSGVPFVGDFIRAGDQWQYFQDYLNNRDIDWSNVKYPSLNIGAGSFGNAVSNAAFGLGYAYVSKNLISMYNHTYHRTGYNHWSYR